MASWAARRRFYYIGGLLLIIASIVTPIVYSILDKPATCFDGIQNQGETAVDMSGPCTILNPQDLIPEAVLWARPVPVVPGIFSGVAYIENANAFGGVREAPYTMRLYDDRNILVAERFGVTALPPGRVVPVFEGGVETGNRTVSRVTFEFTEEFLWERIEDQSGSLDVTNERVDFLNDKPRVEATVENIGIDDVTNIVFVATVFNSDGNAFASSRTLVERLNRNASADITFTWPQAWAERAARIDIIPLTAVR